MYPTAIQSSTMDRTVAVTHDVKIVTKRILRGEQISKREWQNFFWDIYHICMWADSGCQSLLKTLEEELRLCLIDKVRSRLHSIEDGQRLFKEYVECLTDFVELYKTVPRAFQQLDLATRKKACNDYSTGKIKERIIEPQYSVVRSLMLQLWTSAQPKSRSHELLAKYCDMLLRRASHSKKLTDKEIDDRLAEVLLFLRYDQNKEQFLKYHKLHLTRRLMHHSPSISHEREESIIESLRELGISQDRLIKMNRMIRDISDSDELQKKYKEFLRMRNETESVITNMNSLKFFSNNNDTSGSLNCSTNDKQQELILTTTKPSNGSNNASILKVSNNNNVQNDDHNNKIIAISVDLEVNVRVLNPSAWTNLSGATVADQNVGSSKPSISSTLPVPSSSSSSSSTLLKDKPSTSSQDTSSHSSFSSSSTCSSQVKLPNELMAYVIDFEEFFAKQCAGRRLEWHHNLSSGIVSFETDRGKFELEVTASQLSVLLAFDACERPAKDSLNFESLLKATNLSKAELKRTLLTLVANPKYKVQVLVCEPPISTTTPATTTSTSLGAVDGEFEHANDLEATKYRINNDFYSRRRCRNKTTTTTTATAALAAVAVEAAKVE